MNTRQLPVQNGEKKLPVSLLNRECRLSEEGREGQGRNKGEYRKEERGEERDEAELRPLKFESYICCWVAYRRNNWSSRGMPDVSYPDLFVTWRISYPVSLERDGVRYLGLGSGLVLVLRLGVSVRGVRVGRIRVRVRVGIRNACVRKG